MNAPENYDRFDAGANDVPQTAESDQAERRLLMRIAARDQAAMNQLYLLYSSRLRRLLNRITWQRELVDEMINDTFMVIWRKASEFRGDSRVSTWVFAIAYRRRLMALRDESRTRKSRLQIPPGSANEHSEPSCDQLTMTDWVGQALERLPMKQRAALEFTYGLGMSCEEIGTVMQCPANTVKTRVFHARRNLSVALQELELPTVVTSKPS